MPSVESGRYYPGLGMAIISRIRSASKIIVIRRAKPEEKTCNDATVSKKIRLTKETGATYELRPKYQSYYHFVERIAQRQTNGQSASAMDVQGFITESAEACRGMKPRDRKLYGKIGKLKLNSFHTYWIQRFIGSGYWEVVDTGDGRLLSGRDARGILRSFFRHSGSGSDAEYWLVDLSAEIQVEPGSSENSQSAKASLTVNVKHDSESWARLVNHCRRLCEAQVSRLAHKYNARLYVPREKTEQDFLQFLESSQTIFLILGQSGTGKTNVMCHLAGAIQHPSFFTSGEFFSSYGVSLVDELRSALQPVLAGTPDVIAALSLLLESNEAMFILYVDAVNEFLQPSEVLNQLASLSCIWGAAYPRIRFCISCRTALWDRLVQVRGIQFPSSNVYPVANESFLMGTAPLAASGSVVLQDYSDQEMAKAIEVYRDEAHFCGEFTGDGCELFRNPLLLRLAAQTWAGKDMPARVDARQLWDKYWRIVVESGPKGSGELALAIGRLMTQQRASEINDAQISGLAHV